MSAYYNEFDPFAAAWLRELIADGLIPAGDVDERSIVDVQPDDLIGYTQAHFFAGIGGWPYALRLAGWPDDRPVWTGSCPCQPFSAAGRGAGFADERHLWPEFFRLISECGPATVFGEQVASPAGLEWLDAVQADLEGAGYACGAADLCAPSVGAFHIRQRMWWVAYTEHSKRGALNFHREDGRHRTHRGREEAYSQSGARGEVCDAAWSLADARGERLHREPVRIQPRGQDQAGAEAAGRGATVVLGDAGSAGLAGRAGIGGDHGQECPAAERAGRDAGFWFGAEWLPCRDGKARPAKPGIFPLAPRVPNRVGLLRGAGNAIVPQVAAEFIRACEEARAEALIGEAA